MNLFPNLLCDRNRRFSAIPRTLACVSSQKALSVSFGWAIGLGMYVGASFYDPLLTRLPASLPRPQQAPAAPLSTLADFSHAWLHFLDRRNPVEFQGNSACAAFLLILRLVFLLTLIVLTESIYHPVRCNPGTTPPWEPIAAALTRGQKWTRAAGVDWSSGLRWARAGEGR